MLTGLLREYIIHHLRTARAVARHPRLLLAVRTVLSIPVTNALDDVNQCPVLDVLIGVLPP
jgi:hypothetical protein